MHQKAWIIETPGGRFQAVEIPRPEPGHNQILVRISASGVNPLDTKIRNLERFAEKVIAKA